jgi:hypothetical protein
MTATQSPLDGLVADAVQKGWRVESRTPTQVIFTAGKPANHILHLLLTLVTFGLWLIPWAIIASRSGVMREVVTVVDGEIVWSGRPPKSEMNAAADAAHLPGWQAKYLIHGLIAVFAVLAVVLSLLWLV